jgi:HlyD family secretion protein
MKPDLNAELEGLRIARDPQHEPKVPKPWWIIFASALGVLGTATAMTVHLVHNAPPRVAVVRVVASPGNVADDVSAELNATGYIVAHHQIQVASKVSGKVAWIGVDEGSTVTKGQTLVRLDDTEYSAQLQQAQGNLASLRARLMELEHGSRPQEITQAHANLAQSEADLTNGKLSFERSSALYSDGIISKADFETALYNYRNLEAKAGALKQVYELVRKGPRQEEIDSMRGLVKQAEGLLAYDQDQESNTVIRSPINGRVLERAVEQGEYVTNGFVGDKGAKGYVVTLADLNDLQVELDIAENDFSKVHIGSKALVTTDAFPDHKYEGELVEIAPIANRQKATVRVKVQISHPDEQLRPDMNASVAFILSSQRDKRPDPGFIVIPSSAIRDQAVFVLSHGKAVRRPVQAAEATATEARILHGLAEGDQVIVNPPENLKDGENVRLEGEQP